MFDWDEEKNRVNRAKHAIDFSIASWVFRDPHWYGSEDRTADYGEARFWAVGYVGNRMITVVYTERNSQIRIISARRASPHERYCYEENR
ncbi:BrnT family toxin [Rhizobium sp. LjRoot254]|uniref:BrnT family toxin n=1 Tax=Rhizobium sp. LjRoot254 TaxID=3342297 RepID=UPI003ED14313